MLDFNRENYGQDPHKVDVFVHDNHTTNKSQINFINYSQQYCIGIIDFASLTKETSKIFNPNKLRKCYLLFLNTMSSAIKNCNGKVVKNIGIVCFSIFQKTCDETNDSVFYGVFECQLRMPGMNGIQLYHKLSEINLYVKILLVSALNVVHKLLQPVPGLNIREMVRKPVEAEDLILKMRSTIKV